jgi:hypothetical protein
MAENFAKRGMKQEEKKDSPKQAFKWIEPDLVGKDVEGMGYHHASVLDMITVRPGMFIDMIDGLPLQYFPDHPYRKPERTGVVTRQSGTWQEDLDIDPAYPTFLRLGEYEKGVYPAQIFQQQPGDEAFYPVGQINLKMEDTTYQGAFIYKFASRYRGMWAHNQLISFVECYKEVVGKEETYVWKEIMDEPDPMLDVIAAAVPLTLPVYPVIDDTFNVTTIPEKVLMLDIEIVHKVGMDQVPWSIGWVTMDRAVVTGQDIFYCLEAEEFIRKEKKMALVSLSSMDSIRFWLLGKQKEGYVLCAKGMFLEAQFLSGRPLGTKIKHLLKRGFFAYDSALAECKDYPYPATLFDVHMDLYNKLRKMYEPYLSYREIVRRNAEHKLSRTKRRDHLPVAECQVFLLHWKTTLEFMYFQAHWIQWKEYYVRRAFGAKPPQLMRRPLVYWEERLQWIPEEGVIETVTDPWVKKNLLRLLSEKRGLYAWDIGDKEGTRQLPCWAKALEFFREAKPVPMYLQQGVLSPTPLPYQVASWYTLFVRLVTQKVRENIDQNLVKDKMKKGSVLQNCAFLAGIGKKMTLEECQKHLIVAFSSPWTLQLLEEFRTVQRKDGQFPLMTFRPAFQEDFAEGDIKKHQFWFTTKFDVILFHPHEFIIAS